MNRREALQLLATSMAVPLVPRPLLAVAREARALLDAQTSVRTLDAHQQATVRIMAEMILPKTDTPGATDVGTCEFIDLMLTEWYDEPERASFLKGLADVDARSRSLFVKDFVDCTPPQQSDILKALGDEMIEKAPSQDRFRPTRRSAPASGGNFYSMFRRLTLTAYYTSEGGATKELHFEVVPAAYDACAQLKGEENASKGMAKSQ